MLMPSFNVMSVSMPHDRDARAAWTELYCYFTESTAIMIKNQEAVGWLSTAHFMKAKFIGMSTQFLDTNIGVYISSLTPTSEFTSAHFVDR